MRLKGLDLNLLMVLDILLQECNVSRAAQRLGLGQSTVSSSLARLREHFSDELLVKGNQSMLPTALSQELKPIVRQWLQTVTGLLALPSAFVPEHCRATLRIACTDDQAQHLLPQVILAVSQQAPAVHVQLVAAPRGTTENLDTWMARQQIDFMISSDAGSHSETLFEEEWYCIARADHPALQGGLSLEAFNRLSHLRVMGQRFVGDEGRKISAQVSGYLALDTYLARGELIACIPASLNRIYRTEKPLQVWPLPFEAPKLVQQLSWRAGMIQEPLHDWLRQVIRGCVSVASKGALPCVIGL
ncbi:LysR family transcriptional regulator [Pseudomonas sp. A2]|uniref:LysR family transcriptional regulator n=1 Tax=Pseudomonas sp. A2 TaxID=107445 RepID=UPI002ACD0E83|nr:LysR family transcriptional regulator [Pseudomonas sp. A2]MEB3440344.1 LysR family transcriptional regulator [Pseudomonas sp. A2]HEN8736046.1 LysR family transcriptional regulator [Pseudomonas putida]